MFWTYRQRMALSSVVALILCYLVIRYQFTPARISNPQAPEAPRAGELEDRLDPNTASTSDLAALPNLGPAMARRIVEEREAFEKEHPEETAYKKLEDLQRVKGIGGATLENLRPYLKFPATTQPSR
jgi:competence protein ComEA